MKDRLYRIVSSGSQHVNWMVDLKTQTEEVNQGLELDFEDLLAGRACQVKKKVYQQ